MAEGCRQGCLTITSLGTEQARREALGLEVRDMLNAPGGWKSLFHLASVTLGYNIV